MDQHVRYAARLLLPLFHQLNVITQSFVDLWLIQSDEVGLQDVFDSELRFCKFVDLPPFHLFIHLLLRRGIFLLLLLLL